MFVSQWIKNALRVAKGFGLLELWDASGLANSEIRFAKIGASRYPKTDQGLPPIMKYLYMQIKIEGDAIAVNIHLLYLGY